MTDQISYMTAALGAVSVAITGAAILKMTSTPNPIKPCVDLNNQSAEVPNSGGARRSRIEPVKVKNEYFPNDAKTLLEFMENGLRLSNDGPCLGWRELKSEYRWLTYSQVIEKSKNFGSGLINIGMKPGQSSFIGLYAKNCVEWVLAEQACYNQSAVNVPLYDTLGPNACSFIINQANISIVICDTEDKARLLLNKYSETPSLEQIIIIQRFSDDLIRQAKEVNIQLHLFKDIERMGKENPVPANLCKPEDLCTICYTSGTTGTPKGAMLTHTNLTNIVHAYQHQCGEYAFKHSDVMISYLPLAHIFERVCEAVMYEVGGSVGFYRGDVRLLMEDMRVLRPTFFPSVPRVVNKIYDTVLSKVRNSILKTLTLNLALNRKATQVEKGIIARDTIWDKLVFQNIRDSMGGRVRVMLCGSAPISEHVLKFMRCAMGCIVMEVYGQTECLASFTICGDSSNGHVGPPLPCIHIKLVDVPDMNYFAKNGQGEICLRGPQAFKGYLKEPEKTAETIDSDGWVHTGDIGMWLRNGTLKIIDRKKNIFKLAHGEYIAPEKIEIIYLRNKYVSQIFVHGESLQSYLVAIVVPDPDVVQFYCKKNNIEGSWEEICKNDVIKKVILEDITVEGKNAGLKSFEQVKDIYLYPGQFSIENDLLTPTLKVKRTDCRNFFSNQIKKLYSLKE